MAQAEKAPLGGASPRSGLDLGRLQRLRAEWEAGPLSKSLARGERKPSFETPSGLPVDVVYTPADVAGLDYERHLVMPGHYPFTRCIRPNIYRLHAWHIRQYPGSGTPEPPNQRLN